MSTPMVPIPDRKCVCYQVHPLSVPNAVCANFSYCGYIIIQLKFTSTNEKFYSIEHERENFKRSEDEAREILKR